MNGRLWRNGISQALGRLFLSGARLGVALLVLRLAGVERYGEFALVLSLLLIAEWLVDFGLTDIAVRDMSRRPEARGALLSALARAKRFQAVVVYVLLLGLALLLDYSAAVARAGAIGGLGLFCYAAVLIYRAHLRVEMRHAEDVFAEVAGTLVMLPLVAWVCLRHPSVEALAACHVVSRLVFFLVLWRRLGRALPQDDAGAGAAAAGLARQAIPLGLAGLLVCLYDGIAPLLLGKLADLEAVARFTAAARYVFLILVVLQAIATVFFPLLAGHWGKDRAALRQTQQQALDSGFLTAAALFCGVYGAAEFLMGLLSPALTDAAATLRLFAWVVLARALTTVMSPLLVIAGVQGRALWLTVLSLLLQVGAMFWLVPRFGVDGAVFGYLAIELVVGVVPMILIGQRVAGIRLDWSRVARALVAAVVAVAVGGWAAGGGLLGGILALGLYLVLARLSGAISPQVVRDFLHLLKGRANHAPSHG